MENLSTLTFTCKRSCPCTIDRITGKSNYLWSDTYVEQTYVEVKRKINININITKANILVDCSITKSLVFLLVSKLE